MFYNQNDGSCQTDGPPFLCMQWDFLRSQMQGGSTDLLAYPEYFSCSLLNEIGPRYVAVIGRLVQVGESDASQC